MANKQWFLFFGLMAFAGESLAAVCGKFSEVSGGVELLREQGGGVRHAILAKSRMDILCTDIVVTHDGSRAKLRLEKAILTLGPNSRLEVAAEVKGSDQQTLNLPYGKVRTLFKGEAKEGQASRFKVKTPAAVVGVRGTDFYVTYKPNEKLAEQATLTGRVEVVQNATNIRVEVEKGQQVKVDNFDAKLEEKLKAEKVRLEKEKAEELARLEQQQLDEAARKKALAELLEQSRREEIARQKLIEEELKLKQREEVVVRKIDRAVVEEIKQTSALVRNDREFASPAAIEILGAPESWLPAPNEVVPEKFRGYENEF